MDGKDILKKNLTGNRRSIDCCHFDFSLQNGDEFELSRDVKYRTKIFPKGTKVVFAYYKKRGPDAFPPVEMFENVDGYFAWFHLDGEERVRVLEKEDVKKLG